MLQKRIEKFYVAKKIWMFEILEIFKNSTFENCNVNFNGKIHWMETKNFSHFGKNSVTFQFYLQILNGYFYNLVKESD